MAVQSGQIPTQEAAAISLRRPRLRCCNCGHDMAWQGNADSITCIHCGTVYLIADGIPSFVPESTDRTWQALYQNVLQASNSPSQQIFTNSRQHELIKRAYTQIFGQLSAGKTILDVGCGHGSLTHQLTCEHTVYGIDFVYEMLPLARGNGLIPFHGDAQCLPFCSNQFDVVVCSEIIQNFEDIDLLMTELVRVCRPRGLILVSTLHRHSALRRVAKQIRSLQMLLNNDRQKSIVFNARQRIPKEVECFSARLPIRMQRIFWTHFPFSYLVSREHLGYLGAPLASNFILAFGKDGELSSRE